MFRGLFGHGSAWALQWSVSYWTPPVDRNIASTKSSRPLAILCYWQTQVFFMLMRNQKPSGWKPFVFMKAADTRSSSPDLLRVSSDPPRRKMILKHFQIKKSTQLLWLTHFLPLSSFLLYALHSFFSLDFRLGNVLPPVVWSSVL